MSKECVVSVPLRGKEGARRSPVSTDDTRSYSEFPSPCGVRRVRDRNRKFQGDSIKRVSVPLRGKEGARPDEMIFTQDFKQIEVSVPLRGKEGARLG